MGLAYFYDYFAREYRESRKVKLFPVPAAMLQGIMPEDVQRCRKVLKNAFAGYREGRNAEVLKRLLGDYREYVSGCHGGHARDKYNAFVYRYMLEVHIGNKAIGTKLGVTKETVLNYINRCMDEILLLCIGIPAVMEHLGDKEAVACRLVDGSRLFSAMAGDYVLCLFPGKRERETVERGRQLTMDILEVFADAVEAYSGYCNDEHTHIDTDIRKMKVLEKCLAGVPVAAIAEEYECCESTIYADIRENERRLAAMMFNL